MARCCGGAACTCAVEAGAGLEVTGTGAAGDPFIVGLDADTEAAVADSDAARYGWVSPLISTLYYPGYSPGGPATPVIPAEGAMQGSRFIPGADATLVRIGVEVTVIGTAGALIRLGIYSVNLSTGALTLVVDAGTVTGESVGFQEATISTAVSKGVNYLLVASVQGAAGTRPTLRTNAGADPFLGSGVALTASQNGLNGLSAAGVSGALPASVGAGLLTPVVSGNVPRVLVRTA
jgi:hypothetical protein